MKTNILKAIVIAILPVMIMGCHSGADQTNVANGKDSAISSPRDIIKGAKTIRNDSGRILRDTNHRLRDTVKP